MIIGIIGLGLMGGSMGLALKNTKLVSKIVGYDNNIANCEEALKLGLIEEIVNFEDIKKCDVIFLAIPVEAIISTMKNLTDVDKNTTIIDLGSTKDEIVKNTSKELKSNFIPAHPMTGTEKFGPSAAFNSLYNGNVVVICKLDTIDDIHLTRAIQIFSHIGMKIVFMNPKEHDEHAAYISHMPHALSYALANSVMRQQDPKSILMLAGGGFRDMSRVAKSSPVMWSNIFKQNRKNFLSSVKSFEVELAKCREMVENEEWEKLEEWMKNATTLHKIL
ncbi:MAG: prephenate dehydrogenase [Campylobacteraceae bacterium]|jgi:prephenate dehydrogenase|nr:prephenate dehydrogenase [Campylobacteraceae bacterium]